MIRRPPRSTLSSSSAASDVYKRQGQEEVEEQDEEGEEEDVDYFILLGVGRDACSKQIRTAYHKKAMAFHPDRLVNRPEQERKRCENQFNKYKHAFDTLSDPVARRCYELDQQGDVVSEEAYAEVAEIKKEMSAQMMPMLECQFQAVKDLEMNRPGGGLVIISAVYGKFDEPTNESYIDVTVQLQVMVDDSKLILHREGNYCWLEGFHDPCYGQEKVLKLRYLFLEEVHECEFADGQPIFAPLPSHSVKEIKKQERQQKKLQNAALIVGVPVLVAGLYYYFGRRGKK
eukprot:TRINITY_DN20636_c0_g1_i1.p1 TRINITY_DN20636_c0_g1~~TRINITY_DN20636_c0_g1_i1.p1  ORF type:complete len:287 (+),score=89.68 TRINITY_DN20636_c0_g1_i1:140-1000(+)